MTSSSISFPFFDGERTRSIWVPRGLGDQDRGSGESWKIGILTLSNRSPGPCTDRCPAALETWQAHEQEGEDAMGGE